MKFIMAFITALSFQAFGADYEAKEVNFTVSDRTSFGNRVFYNCDSVEHYVATSLEDLGARNITVRCSGGLDRFGNIHLPARVSSTFEALNSSLVSSRKASMQEVVFRDHDNCHLMNSIIKSVMGEFEVASVEMRRCTSANAATRIKITVLKED